MLTQRQRNAASMLRTIRPPTIPGTNAVIDRKLCDAWYDEVNAAMLEHRVVGSEAINEFCNVAGVPD